MKLKLLMKIIMNRTEGDNRNFSFRILSISWHPYRHIRCIQSFRGILSSGLCRHLVLLNVGYNLQDYMRSQTKESQPIFSQSWKSHTSSFCHKTRTRYVWQQNAHPAFTLYLATRSLVSVQVTVTCTNSAYRRHVWLAVWNRKQSGIPDCCSCENL